MLMSIAVANLNLMFAKGAVRRATPPNGVPASAAQYRCLEQIYDRIHHFLCGVERPGSDDPQPGFSRGEDTLAQFLKCEEAVSGLGVQLSPVRPLSAASAALSEKAGNLDPVLWIGGEP